MPERAEYAKLSHEAVDYERTSEHPGESCGNCKHVIEAISGTRCESVKAPIYLNGWCKRWAAQPKS